MEALQQFHDTDIDWDLTPEMAVTMYLEWGNNNWHGDHPPVRGKHDVSHYFVVDTWEEEPKVVLIRRNSEETTELASLALPREMARLHKRENGPFKGVFSPPEPVKQWLKGILGQN